MIFIGPVTYNIAYNLSVWLPKFILETAHQWAISFPQFYHTNDYLVVVGES